MTKLTQMAQPATLEGSSLKTSLLIELNTALEKHMNIKHYCVSTLLDPRFRQKCFTVGQNARTVDIVNSDLKAIQPDHKQFVPVSPMQLFFMHFCPFTGR
jgi:hypothetical protein